ncbi:energy-coupling factor transporter transmembrane protein EcfT [Candidatus Tisiphia endosymbiont of Ptychoptera albimana]|uniref:energy-coupling factor transporter transmembrane component T family protein n=1 Tax=Candidatus Tisiphia endosymbiont of Ptychoptera albimana TaxID=3066260 RepID=UPI00312C9F3D
MNLDTYYQYNSPIHRLSPRIKLYSLVVFSSGLFLVSNLFLLSISLFFTFFLYFIAKIPLQKLFIQLRQIIIILLIILLVHIFTNNWIIGVQVTIRFATLLLFASLITLTTRISEMIDSLNEILILLSYVGINHKKISLSLSLAIRFIPVIVSIFQEISVAQRTRGLERNFIATIIPTIIKILKTAENIAEAIESRSW